MYNIVQVTGVPRSYLILPGIRHLFAQCHIAVVTKSQSYFVGVSGNIEKERTNSTKLLSQRLGYLLDAKSNKTNILQRSGSPQETFCRRYATLVGV